MPARQIKGFNITTSEIEPVTVDLPANTDQRYMSGSSASNGFMQGVIIGSSAFGFTRNGANSFTINKYGKWKEGNNAVTASSTFTVEALESSQTSTNTYPVLCHNLKTNTLEVFFTTTRLTRAYKVHHLVINPDNLTKQSETVFNSDYLIGQTVVSRGGSSAAQSNDNTSRTAALTFTGFIDYYTNTYYLPILGFYQNEFIAIPSRYQNYIINETNTDAAWTTGHSFGMRLNIVNNAFAYKEPFYITGLTVDCPLRHAADDGTVNEFCYRSYQRGRWTDHYSNNATTIANRILQWGYSKPRIGNFSSNVVQMLPLSGAPNLIYGGAQGSYPHFHVSNSFALVALSKVMCGIDFPSTGIRKNENDIVTIQYGWSVGPCEQAPVYQSLTQS
jgi:hypothetical protein